jgi:hypothetical protein
VLPKRPGYQWEGGPGKAADQGDIITGSGKGSTDPYHTLIIVEIIGDRTKDLFLHRDKYLLRPSSVGLRIVFSAKRANINQLGGYNGLFCAIFAVNF